ncbi:MAG: M28 family peptidase [Acidimicrobiia bacterium]|nr:M28 family peptidase [Acidimicrobiia bacterium]
MAAEIRKNSEAGGQLGHLETLCSFLPDRRPGSHGNLEATSYAAAVLTSAGWQVSQPDFDCIDWRTEGGRLQVAGVEVPITPSPYGLGVDTTGPVRVISDPADLDRPELHDAIVVLTGSLAKEPLTPKRFPFYGSEEHTRIINAIEEVRPAAVLAITGKYPALCGALDPYPLIEDGDFTIATANVRPADAKPLLSADGRPADLEIRSERWSTRARNVIATRGPQAPRVTVMAHIDTKPGTPGAVDNAAGVVVLFLVAERLAGLDLPIGVELVAINGEDHYAAPGELDWLAANRGRLDDIALLLNIDGAGYRGGRSAFSTYNLEPLLEGHVATTFANRPSLVPGPEFYQSDHAIFAMRGRPAMAITTELVDEMLETLFHAPTDTPEQVDPSLLVDIADGISGLIMGWPLHD